MTEYQNNPIPTHSDDRSDSLTCSFPILWLEATLSVCTSFCQWLSSGAAESSSSWSSEPFPSTLSTKHSNWVQTEKSFVEDLLFFPPTNIEYWQFNLLFSLVINVEICVVFYHQSRSVWVGIGWTSEQFVFNGILSWLQQKTFKSVVNLILYHQLYPQPRDPPGPVPDWYLQTIRTRSSNLISSQI